VNALWTVTKIQGAKGYVLLKLKRKIEMKSEIEKQKSELFCSINKPCPRPALSNTPLPKF